MDVAVVVSEIQQTEAAFRNPFFIYIYPIAVSVKSVQFLKKQAILAGTYHILKKQLFLKGHQKLIQNVP